MDDKVNYEIQKIRVMDLGFVYPESFKGHFIHDLKSSAYCILCGIEYYKLPIEFISKRKKHFWNYERNILYSKVQPVAESYVRIANTSYVLTNY